MERKVNQNKNILTFGNLYTDVDLKWVVYTKFVKLQCAKFYQIQRTFIFGPNMRKDNNGICLKYIVVNSP